MEMAQFAQQLTYEALPEDLLVLLRRSFVDSMGVAAIGSTTDLSKVARKGAMAIFGTGAAGGSRMLFDGRTVSPAGAAMAGAFTVDSIDAHDGNTPNKGHAGSAIFPSLLAIADSFIAQEIPVRGRDFALWLAVAYEVSYRAGQVQHATCADYHTSGAWTAVGVAAAAARMLGCTTEQIRHAAGIGEYHGPRSQMMRCIDHPTMVRDGVGWGAPTCVTAAYLAREGFTGAPALTCEGPEAAPFWSDLGHSWLTLRHTHYKLYPCCRWAHPALDAAQDLMRQHELHHSGIERVDIRTFHYATRLAGHEPKTMDDLAYSIAFPVATMLVRGKLGATELREDVFADADILRVSRSVNLIDDEEMTARSIDERWASVAIVMKDGRVLASEPRTPRGDTDLPLSDAEIGGKFHSLADDVLGSRRASDIESLCDRFDHLDASEFETLLGACLSPA